VRQRITTLLPDSARLQTRAARLDARGDTPLVQQLVLE